METNNSKDETDCLDPEEMKGIPPPPREISQEIRPYLKTFTPGCSEPDVYGFAF